MKHHRTEGSIALKTKEELARELDKLLDTDIHNIADKNRWMLDMDPAGIAVMSIRETQYAIFELKAAKSQDKAVDKRTNRATKDFKEYCNIPGMCVPTTKAYEHEGCIEEEREERKRQEKETAAKKEVEIKIAKMKSQNTGRKSKRRKKETNGKKSPQPQGIKTS
jgi:hypothetical protein